MAWGKSLTADNTVPTQVPLQHAIRPFPFNAELFPPNGSVFKQPSVSELLDAARLKELEEASKSPEEKLQQSVDETNEATVEAVRELVKILRDPKATDGAKLGASQQILSNAMKNRDFTKMEKRLAQLEALFGDEDSGPQQRKSNSMFPEMEVNG